jgi:hypothetical protein
MGGTIVPPILMKLSNFDLNRTAAFVAAQAFMKYEYRQGKESNCAQ